MSPLASHNHIVWSYFDIARKITQEATGSASDVDRRSKSAVSILMAVAAVEAYINIFGRMWIEQTPDFINAGKIVEDLNKRKSITHKIKTWPTLFFGKGLDLSGGIGQAFRSGSISLDRMFSSLSGALRWSAYAAVCRVGRLSKYTPSGV